MIIQCEQCSTKFRLDDAKIKDKGVKVRCAKCRHVFTVTKQQQEQEPQPDAETGFERPVAPGPGDEPSFAPPAAEQSFAPAGDGDFDFSFSESMEDATAGHDKAATPSSEPDFSDFDFGGTAESGSGATESMANDLGGDSLHPAADVSVPDAAGFDFGAENLFGDAVATPVHEEPAEPIAFDFPVEAFADSMGAAEKTSGGKADLGGIEADKADEPFSLGEIDFGDELTSVAVQQVNPEELKPAQELFFAPPVEPQKGEGAAEEAATPPLSVPQEELPPLSIISRRRQSPLLMGLVTVLVVLVVAVVGYVGYSMLGAEKVAKDSGRISVRGVNAVFVKNRVAGELVAISGEAVNEFSGPRAAIQVKGMIYGPAGQVLASKNAFCGNPLTKEQLAAMPLEKIEAAMANQFGDSLDNLEVPPGKAIPFVIVIAGPPADAKDYGVEPAGSTVATEKQPQH
ncbi:DUF3426 domain-containing protein [Geobacter sp. AOG2]|uniref:DUF3426 domain-containing protein n=1 Tax=Geobacter sp. AOG2 TaxID=1566347 RepID=UPI001CC4390E|nr:DUF3426 domain-containing protein [Geobacter sp. AOG2]GFE62229.1 hypothetical protein AOG2_28170 [Geobacter sp. AOG2]